MPTPGEELPTALEDLLFEAHFESTGDDRDERIERLCTQHPEHAAALRRHAAILMRGEQLISPAHEQLADATEHQLIGPFHVQHVLGTGGFGTVYLAEQQRPVRRAVALKVLQTRHVDSRARQRFEDERQVLARLQHANIAMVFDAGVTDAGSPYFAMEYVDGPPITSWQQQHRPGLQSTLRLFLRICAAVHHAHQRAVVHRDLKPSNVLVADDDGQAQPKVIDFGIAKLLEATPDERDQTMQGAQIGTPGYMSPEQAAGEAVDTRTDVYSLGILLCELLTGELPFDRERLRTSSFVNLARMLQEEPPTRPSALLARRTADAPEIANQLRSDLDWIVLRAIAADRDDRYPSVAALADDVERHLRGEPVQARQSTASYVVGKFVKRHRLAVFTAAVLLIATIAVIASLAWGLREVGSAQLLAEHERDIAQARDMAARMSVAQLATESGNMVEARAFLATVPIERRNWEWRHLIARCDSSERCIAANQPNLEVDWLDDERVLAFPMSGKVQVLHRTSGLTERTFGKWRGNLRRALLDRPTGRALIAADGGLSLWNANSGEQIAHLREFPGEPFALAWSEDRKIAAVGGRGRWLDIVAVDTSKRARRLRMEASPSAIAFLPDHQLLLGDEAGGIRRIDRRSNKVLQRFEGHTDVVEALLVQPERDLLYTASVDTTVRVWQLSTGELRTTLRCKGRMRRLQLSADGSMLYACGGWSTSPLSAWETKGFTMRGHFLGHQSGVGALALSPDGERLATVSRDRTVRIWPRDPSPAAQRLDAGRDARSIAIDPSRTHFATASIDGHINIWNAATLAPQLSLHTKSAYAGVALGERVLYVAGHSILALDRKTGKQLAEGTRNNRRVERMLLTPGGRWLVGGYGKRVLVWQLPELELRHDLPFADELRRMQWDPVHERVLLGTAKANVQWLDPVTGAFGKQLEVPERDGRIDGLRLRDGLLVVGIQRMIKLYRDDQLVRQFAARNNSADLSADLSRLVTGAADNTVRIWDAETGNQLLVFDEPIYSVSQVHFLQGDERIVALSHRWDAPTYVYVWSAPRDARLPR